MDLIDNLGRGWFTARVLYVKIQDSSDGLGREFHAKLYVEGTGFMVWAIFQFRHPVKSVQNRARRKLSAFLAAVGCSVDDQCNIEQLVDRRLELTSKGTFRALV